MVNVTSVIGLSNARRRRLVALVAHCALLSALPAVAAPISFELPIAAAPADMPLEPLSATSHSIATDGNGVWIAVWPVAGVGGGDTDIVYIRSIDGAVTWSAPQLLNGDALTDDADDPETRLSLVTDGAGTWIAAWDTPSTLGGTTGADYDIVYSRSTDNGQTWAAVQSLNADAATDTLGDFSPAIANNGAGRWIAVWGKDTGSFCSSSYNVATSDDGGATWTNPDAVTTSFPTAQIAVAGTPAGTWVAAWTEKQCGPAGPGAVVIRSSDDAMTWSTVSTLGDIVLGTNTLATDGAGTWILAYDDFSSSPASPGPDADIVMIRSIDDGATWSSPQPLDPNAAQPHQTGNSIRPQIIYDTADNRWVATWTVSSLPFGPDTDVVFSISRDAGATWDSPVAINGRAARDSDPTFGADFHARVATDGADTWVALYLTEPLDLAGLMMARSFLDCPVAPASGCKSTAPNGRSTLSAKRINSVKDSLKWKWKGAATDAIEFGTPVSTTKYLMCMYDTEAGMPRLVFEKDVAPGETCSERPCWQTTSKKVLYSDKRLSSTSVKLVDLRSGGDGKASVAFQAAGPHLGLPVFPLGVAPEVRVQLVNDESGACWEASYDTLKRNTEAKVTARTP